MRLAAIAMEPEVHKLGWKAHKTVAARGISFFVGYNQPVYVLHREQFIAKPLARVFPFFERPENLALITPSWLNFVTLTPGPIQMKEGLRIDYAIRVLGIRQRWTSLISLYQPPHRFVDEQIRGPYLSWTHRHEFTEKEGGTLVTDHLEYEVPFGVFGQIAHALYVRHALQKVFDFRKETVDLLLA